MLKRLMRSMRAARPAAGRKPAGGFDRPIAFITQAQDATWVDPDQPYYSTLASMRLRLVAPARALARLGPVAIIPLEQALQDPGLAAFDSPGTIVMGKLASSDVVRLAPQLSTLTDWLRSPGPGVRAFADLSDNYAAFGKEMQHPFPEEYQRRLGEACPLIVPCAGLAEELAPWAVRGVHVVEDPWESPRQNPPRVASGERVRMLWFGMAGVMTFQHMRGAFVELLRSLHELPLTFTIVTSEHRAEFVRDLEQALRRAHADLEFRFLPWTLETTWRAIDECDFVLLPNDTAASWSRGKSHNRMVEAIRGGRLAVASPIPSYVELERFAWVGDSLAEGIRWALAHPREAERRIAAGQAAIASRFSPDAVGRRWCEVLGVAGRDGSRP
jgi:hypothetical protein